MGSTPEPRSEPGAYPADLEADTRTRDGATIFVRPIRPDDVSRLVDFHEHLSDQSVFRRYFFLHPHLSPEEVDHLTTVDYTGRLALVALDGSRMVGVARYERIAGTQDAEVAFVIADAYQGRGIGTALLYRLASAARDRGIDTFVAQTQADNRNMIDVFVRSGFPFTSSSEWGTVNVRFRIDVEPEAHAVPPVDDR